MPEADIDNLRRAGGRAGPRAGRPPAPSFGGAGGRRGRPARARPLRLGAPRPGHPDVAIGTVPAAATGLRAPRARPTSSSARSSRRARGSSPRNWSRSSDSSATGSRPSPSPTVRRTIEEDLGRPLAEVFVSFDRVPIASASIAQVHAATLRTGERVVVKVQRRTVASLVRLDIAAMSWIAPMLVGRIPITALTNPPALVELFAETIVEELDFRLEAQNMLDIAGVFAVTGERFIVVPRPHPGAGDQAGAGHGAPPRLRLGQRRRACGPPASTRRPCCVPASSPSSREPSSTGCSTATCTAGT